ncbi:MAG: thioredoxin domain-containing protein [Gemmatimonadales bacterium]
MAQTQKPFLIAIGVIILAGAAFIGLRMTKSNVSIPANPIVTTADTAGFQGYLLGSPDAPIEITEYADYQCPGCGAFATVQFPDIKVRLIDAGKVRFRYRDFPLDGIHRHARIAAHTAACADDQGKFWDVEHRIYARQNDWAFQSDALPVMESIIRDAGLDQGAWMTCMQSAKHAGRIQASYDEGVRVGVPQTPTFRIEGRLYTALSADGMVRLVDSLIAAKAAATQQAPAPLP